MSYQQHFDAAAPKAPSAQPHDVPKSPVAHGFQNLQLKSELGFMDVIGHLIIWIVLTLVTFGIALFVFPYYMQKFIIGKTYAYDGTGKKIGRLVCTIDLASIIGNILLWILISIVTLGIGYFVFLYKINAHCMTHTKIVAVNSL
ncbi:DUF4234 domain-containing protein [Paralcaligenes sp. KSB-10]|uniref:DUF4234 domain-containing protein n=1 Tax=Paralcaligenes sp. KSB-10 TaxID=2901142 RepID=UPI001E538EBF|nr:DUF4234 domain-containing protein [Paralcaligenes sp. KSB-10]UHL65746.1 DUF4234 domain-containing protein [Paralcaligenes sp. KSB-10]